MLQPSDSTASTLNAFRVAQFALLDLLRRMQGEALGAYGLGPSECPYRIVMTGSHWRLRDYAVEGASPDLLIVAAPIKRPYIWDLAPSVSAVRHCLRNGLHLRLLEWMPAKRNAQQGLEEYTAAIAVCLGAISEGSDCKPLLIGHSLGGTLAAIFAASAPERIRGLVLLNAPLCFRPETSQFRDALVSLVPSGFPAERPCPGSLLSHVSALASPDTFVWSRLADAAISMSDYHALDIQARVERWALDEVRLSGKLVRELIEWLYRENRFYRGELRVGGKHIGPSTLSTPTLAVVNLADEVAPMGSVEPFTEAMPQGAAKIIQYPGERGVGLQHLGILVGRQAHRHIWPRIPAWLENRH